MSEGARRRSLLDSIRVRRALGLPGPEEVREYAGVATDTRAIRPGDLFVALEGERHHGADFLEEAAAAGARGAIVPPGRAVPDLDLEWLVVDDPLRALGDLAAWWRREAGARVVGVTGSSGKTTVKEMIARSVGAVRPVHATTGNLNSLSGLPLSIFDAPAEAEVWVLELGANRPGEIPRLTGIAAPDDAVITTVGPAHLEYFGDVETVMREKLALVAGASPAGAVVVGERPPELGREARRIRPDAVVAGYGEEADFRPDRYDIGAERVWFEREGTRYEVEAGGAHHLRDALLAAAVAEALGVDRQASARGLAGFRPLGMRSALRRFGDLTVLADCYNANPESFAAAIEYCVAAFPDRRLAAVVGTMLELGEREAEAHREVAAWLVEAGFSLVAATGAFAPAAREAAGARGARNGTRFLAAEDPEEVWEPLATELRGDEVVLVKGSRGVRLERILERLERRFARADDPAGTGREGDRAPRGARADDVPRGGEEDG